MCHELQGVAAIECPWCHGKQYGKSALNSIHDWASRAAAKILDEYSENIPGIGDRYRATSEARVAAIIATFAEPWLKLLREPRPHATWCATDRREWECDCGADDWNMRVDEAMK
jgi:hypothetical protein